MRVAITADVADENSPVSPIFGRCAYYAIYDSTTDRLDFVPNPGGMMARGAGVQAGQFLAEQGVQMVITAGMVGPNAAMVLGQAGIEVVNGFQGSVRDAVEMAKSGQRMQLAGMNYAPAPMSKEDEIRMLEEERMRIEERLAEIKKRLEELSR